MWYHRNRTTWEVIPWQPSSSQARPAGSVRRSATPFYSRETTSSPSAAGTPTLCGICTIRFVPREKGVTYYADEIKVSVALDTASVVAADARGYLAHHTARSLPEKKITLETAVGNLADGLDLLDYKTAVILLDDGTESLCHELHCRDKAGQEVLVYADTQEEKEADLRLLFTADDGTLAK